VAASDENFRTIWLDPDDAAVVRIIDQRRLPHAFVVHALQSWQDGNAAISDMLVRGAPLIGATAAWSLYLAALAGGRDEVGVAARALLESRPTAVNLRWAIERVLARLTCASTGADPGALIRSEAEAICREDIEISLGIGRAGLELLRDLAKRKSGPVNVLTHCNAGALATINWGTATAPVYLAHNEGIDVHVWVDETRPRNQGSQLTAWELGKRGVPHTLIVDNAGGHLMQHGLVDIVITGTDRTTRCGDVANKIGTYLKALAAQDNNVPFYVALPSTTIDWSIRDGIGEIPIEQRDSREVSHIQGELDGEIVTVNTTAGGTPVSNFAFDVTPAQLVSGLITERGICAASEAGLLGLFPEYAEAQATT
jgi:methylthioribose-1-phosphate isomerase